MATETIDYSLFVQSVSIRLDYYSLDSFYQDYFRNLQEKNSTDLDFTVRPLTEDEIEIVNVDSVSNILGLSLTEVIGRRCIIMLPIIKDGFSLQLIVGPYFLFCRADITDNKKFFPIDVQIFLDFFCFESLERSLTSVLLSCFVHSNVYLDSINDGQSFFKEGVFPTVTDELENSRYADHFRLDDSSWLELVREYRKGIIQKKNQTVYQYTIDALSSSSDLTIDQKVVIPKLINASSAFTSNCYNTFK